MASVLGFDTISNEVQDYEYVQSMTSWQIKVDTNPSPPMEHVAGSAN